MGRWALPDGEGAPKAGTPQAFGVRAERDELCIRWRPSPGPNSRDATNVGAGLMAYPGEFVAMIQTTVFVRAAKVAGSGMLGMVVLSFVAAHSGPQAGEAVVHVVEADVEVTIGEETYAIRNRRYPPIVCELPAGRHELIMRRGGRILYRESFTLGGGDCAVLTAWDPAAHRKAPARGEPCRPR